MFCGEGHKQPILAIDFHPNGKWLLSGGLDTAVCLWSIPSLKELERDPNDDNEASTEPKIVYYPHFHSTEVHHNYVDTIKFYGDLIISKACRYGDKLPNEILLWRIDGFDPDQSPPGPPIPVPDVHTRSAFPHSPRSLGFQRLLSFQIPHTDRFYHRFGLLQQPDMRPILCMGTQMSRFLFWDLQRLEEGWDPAEDRVKKKPSRKNKTGVSAENLNRLQGLRRASSVTSSDAGTRKSGPFST